MKPVLALIFCAAVMAYGPAAGEEADHHQVFRTSYRRSRPKGMAALKFKQRAEELLAARSRSRSTPTRS